MTIKICVGSSCHLKGSYEVIKKLEEIVKANNLEDKVNLVGAFCLGKCGNKVTMQIDDEFVFAGPEDDLEKLIFDRLGDN